MFVELIEYLRCPRTHESSALVASATRVVARHIVEGILGCPVCGAEFVVSGGVARFGEAASVAAESPSDHAAMRLAAFLELTGSGGFALLCGSWASHAEHVQRLADTPLVLVNPPASAPIHVAAAVMEVGAVMPLADGSARAAALDAHLSAELVASIVGAVRPGGRLTGTATLPLPEGVAAIVRDEEMWVGARAADGGTGLIQLSRART